MWVRYVLDCGRNGADAVHRKYLADNIDNLRPAAGRVFFVLRIARGNPLP